ncbi:MAG TPA: argininosuccinate lyase [Nitrososphaeraceae archaeon]
MYRSRSEKNLEDSTLRFLSSGKADKELIYYDILGTQAHCIMLHEIGILTVSEVEQILSALVKLEANPALINLSTFEDVHESLEAFVIDQTKAEIGGKVHTARSRNDQVVLDMRMKIRDDLNNTSSYLLDLINSLLRKASENVDTVILFYTHSQQAQIGTFSHLLLSYVETLSRDLDRLNEIYDRINTCPLGGGAIGGSSIGINRNRTAALLGFIGLVTNSIDATSSRDTMCEYVSSLGIIMITLSRISADLILWSTSEFGYIDISDENSSTSSAMPQKKNPDPLEIIRGKSGSLLGNLNSVFSIVKSLPTGYSRDLQEIKPALWEASNSVQNSLQILEMVIDSLYVHRERMEQMAVKSYAISIDIAEQLVVKNRMPFRSAHKIVGALVEKAVSSGNMPLSGLKKEQIKEVLLRLNSDLKVEDIMQLIANLTPKVSVSLRLSEGSPNPKCQQLMIDELKRKALAYDKSLSGRKRCISESLDALRREVKNYLPDFDLRKSNCHA